MGTARNMSWSWSRQALFRRCPRAFFFSYYPWGEPEQDVLAFLKKARSIPLLVGDVAHFFISLALDQYKTSGRPTEELVSHAVRRYDDALRWSLRTADMVAAGKRAGTAGSVLLHHLDFGASEAMESAGRETLVSSIKAFETSSAWEFLQTTSRRGWFDVTKATDSLPYVEARASLGFNLPEDIRLYTPYDLALWNRRELHIIDWKTGKPKPATEADAKKQLAAYSLWALTQRAKLENVRVQPFFLRPGQVWDPREVSQGELASAIAEIEAHHRNELALVERVVERGPKPKSITRVFWRAKREDFPPRPRPAICINCNFRFVCDEGRAVVNRPADQVLPTVEAAA